MVTGIMHNVKERIEVHNRGLFSHSMFFGGGTDAPFGADFLAPSETATQEEFSPYLILPGSAACRGRIRSKSANAGNLVSEGILHCHSGCNRIAGGGSS